MRAGSRRASRRFAQALDRERDGGLTQEEAAGDLNVAPSFAAMDINRDAAVSVEELRRFLELKFGAAALPTAEAPAQSR